ncbi:MAG: amidohydrolase family protein [Gammaproteobacteria bacterium]
MNRFAIRATIALLSCQLASAVAAQSFAITNARVHTMTEQGTLEGATVVIDNGVIRAVGVDIDVPDAATTIDAQGRALTPGIFDVLSSLGAVEVNAVEESDDTAHSGHYGAGFDIADAINPRSSVIGVNRIEGVTRALVVPRMSYEEADSVLVGQAAAIALSPNDEDVVVARRVAMVAYLGEAGAGVSGGSRAAAVQRLREALQDADDYNRHRDDFDEGDRRAYSVPRLDLEALLPVVSGRTPLIVHANRVSDLRVLIELKRDLDLNLIVAGAAEAWQLADELATSGIPVIIDPYENLPGSFDSLNATFGNAQTLQEAGVMMAFAQGDSHNPRNLTQAAGNAVAHGLDWEAALAAITVNPARMLGLDGDCCTIEPGTSADVVLWDGDPLDVTTFADEVFVAGERIDMRSRQTLLRDRYRQIDGPLPHAYRKP